MDSEFEFQRGDGMCPSSRSSSGINQQAKQFVTATLCTFVAFATPSLATPLPAPADQITHQPVTLATPSLTATAVASLRAAVENPRQPKVSPPPLVLGRAGADNDKTRAPVKPAARPRPAVRSAPSPTVHLVADGRRRTIPAANTVADTLRAAGIRLGDLDRVTPRPDTAVSPDMEIRVTRVQHVTDVREEPIPFHTTIRYSSLMRPGSRRLLTPGQPGTAEVTDDVWLRDGVETLRKTLGRRVVTPPRDAVVLMGAGQMTSRGLPPRGRRTLIMEATAYTPGRESCGRWADGVTYSGLKAHYGVAAVDPAVIPLGARLYIKGYGYAIAADVGSAIKGMKIDLCHDSYHQAIRLGRRNVEVTILD